LRVSKEWKRFILISLFVLFIFLPKRADAQVLYQSSLLNTSQGARGVQTTTHIRNRHLGDEYYLCSLVNAEYARTVLAWQIAQIPSEGHYYFHPFVHIKYPISSCYYGRQGHEYWKLYTTYTVTENAWHTLKIDARYAGDTHYWNLYFDGSYVEWVWYPYPRNNMACTQLECFDASYFFQGRHTNIYLKCADDIWRLQDSSWGPRIVKYYSPGNPYRIIYNYLYYDWEARY